jgi:hypothetical protein
MSVPTFRLSPAPLLLLTLLAASAHAANKTGNVNNALGLSYGKFIAGTGGTVVISTAGVRSKTGGVVLLNGGAINAASFSLTESGAGKSLSFTNITLPTTATMTSGANSMTLRNFVSDPPNTVLGTGRTTVLVGATLTVAPDQAPGNYSGSFVVTVNYQ